MSPYRPSRREFLIGVGSLLVLAPFGCGGESGGGGETTSSGTRAVEHAGGTTEVPENPQRVIALGEALVAHLVSVDLTPVAANESGSGWVRPYRERYDEDLQISEIRAVGTTEEPNLERIASIGPDLILTETSADESIRDRLAEIAPTVAIFRGEFENYPEQEPSNTAWKQAFDQTVRAVGRQQKADQWRQRYQEQVAQAREVSEEISVSLIRPSGDGTFTVDGSAGGFAGSVAAEAGFTVADPPEGVGEENEGRVNISNEHLDVANGDYIVTVDWRDFGVDETAVETFERNPLWETLPAVEAGRVLLVPGQIYNGGTYAYATALLRELREAVVGDGETTVGSTS